MFCSYLLHRCDVIRIFKLCLEERGVSQVVICSMKMRRTSHQVLLINMNTDAFFYLLSVLGPVYTYPDNNYPVLSEERFIGQE